MITVLVLSFGAFAIGVLLCGIALMKETFWPIPYRRVEAGSVAVETRPAEVPCEYEAPVVPNAFFVGLFNMIAIEVVLGLIGWGLWKVFTR